MTGTWDCSQARIALGVYVLGAIDPAERALVDAHLATCEACQAELAALADLPALLAMVPAEEALTLADGLPDDLLLTGSPAVPALADLPGIPAATPMRMKLAGSGPATDPLGQNQLRTPERAGSESEPLAPVLDLTAARRRRRRLAGVGAVAAAAVVVGAASFGGVRLAASPAPVTGSAGAVSAHPNGPPEGAWETASGGAGQAVATIDYRSMGWGIQLETKVFHIPIDTPCQMWVVKSDGARVYAGSWITDNHEGQVWYPASAATPEADVKAFVISVSGGQQITVTPA
jgi:hypothetical protein